ncbi:hypothetical protein ACEN88_32660 [Massilia sp. CT11-108]|uniref:hypothetical protein n=1 Tax=Massilia sp. CT11-108 TaxID=3393900 RepID=UPI0039A786A4
MKRLAWLTIMMGALWAGAGHAADASLCKSMCSAEKRECRANAEGLALDDGGSLLDLPEKNPMARAAQEQVPSEAAPAPRRPTPYSSGRSRTVDSAHRRARLAITI